MLTMLIKTLGYPPPTRAGQNRDRFMGYCAGHMIHGLTGQDWFTVVVQEGLGFEDSMI
jgi:hypothetical protein